MDAGSVGPVSFRVGIIGCGIMGQAIVGALLDTDTCPADRLSCSVHSAESAEKLRRAFADRLPSIEQGDGANRRVATQSDVVLLCTRPHEAMAVLRGMADTLRGKMLISVCAGVSLTQLRSAFSPEGLKHVALVRAMPNTTCRIRHGMTVLAMDDGVKARQREDAQKLFAPMGRVLVLAEQFMNTVTGLSGSGPAFVYVIIEAMADGGVLMGLPKDVALTLAAQAVVGAGQMVLQTGDHPAVLRDRVTTPGGCTIAGLMRMEDGNLRAVLGRTVQDAAVAASRLGQN